MQREGKMPVCEQVVIIITRVLYVVGNLGYPLVFIVFQTYVEVDFLTVESELFPEVDYSSWVQDLTLV